MAIPFPGVLILLRISEKFLRTKFSERKNLRLLLEAAWEGISSPPGAVTTVIALCWVGAGSDLHIRRTVGQTLHFALR